MAENAFAIQDLPTEKEYVIPDLPVNKDYHFFISYHNSDTATVHTLVEILERKGVKCCYYERDFIPGSTLFENIREKMSNSVHMLIILSEGLATNPYIKHEITEALHRRINDGYPIIPIMVEPCTVPADLKNIRYIDAKDVDVSEMPSLIIDAMVKNKIKADYQRTTGSEVSIALTRYAGFPRFLSLSRYKLDINENVRRNLRYSQFDLTNHELKEIEDIVNSSYLVQYWHIFSHFVLVASLLLFIVFMLSICVYLTVMITITGLTEDDSKSTLTALHVSISVVILAIFVSYCFCWNINNKMSITSKYSKLAAQYKLWQQLVHALSPLNQEAREKGRIILFNFTSAELKLIRYDFGICQAQFLKRCEQQDRLRAWMRNGQSLKDYTDLLFDNFVKSERCIRLTEPSATTRHTLSNGAKCLCLLIEEDLS
ncbi:uncharacterized protein LOC127834381 [Dreissena polymorpha]|uniref:TIR domain-containing protein n=1 Tax=Dreissena polymorpha TaxID=45954 RepID=A0A9D4RT36_DREPO|nr:uncharacterized protein LOC127834381 [Dreissena polymorpha]KAH3880636.1 hypothetical protein DPMN_004555 [Dreissena polymorpha]